jgi:hypothetical protein
MELVSQERAVELFVSLCERLRAMGACKVEALGMFATFPLPAVAEAKPAVTVVHLSKPADPKPAPKPEDFRRYDGEQLTHEDVQRRQGYADLQKTLEGS